MTIGNVHVRSLAEISRPVVSEQEAKKTLESLLAL